MGLLVWFNIIYKSVYQCIWRKEDNINYKDAFYFNERLPNYIYSSTFLDSKFVDFLVESISKHENEPIKYLVPGIMTGNVSEYSALEYTQDINLLSINNPTRVLLKIRLD